MYNKPILHLSLIWDTLQYIEVTSRKTIEQHYNYKAQHNMATQYESFGHPYFVKKYSCSFVSTSGH